MITIDIFNQADEETYKGVSGVIKNMQEKNPKAREIFFHLNLNSRHFLELHIRGFHDCWHQSMSFPFRFTMDDYYNRRVVKWIMINYENMRILALG
jgi:hypothetical protein